MPAKKKVWEAHIYLPEDMYRNIESLAEKNERSLTGQIRFMLMKQPSTKGSDIAQNCKHWKDGRCSVCGVAHQFEEVAASFHCAYFTQRN